MSYDCCKRISLDKKNNKMKVCVASSNVFPKSYENWEIYNSESESYKDYSWEDKLISLFADMQSGNLQITSLNDNTEKFVYALCKVREWLKENNLDSYKDLYERRGEVATNKRLKIANIIGSTNEDKWQRSSKNWEKINEWEKTQDKNYIKELGKKIWLESLWEVYGEAYKIWKQALEEKINGTYNISVFGNYVITKMGKYDRGYSRFYYGNYGGLDMSYKKAYIIKCDMGTENRKMEIIQK